MITRRALLAAPAVLTLSRTARAEAKILRIGTQKGGPILMAERQQRGMEALLNPLGVEVKWLEFAFGPPIMEAIRVGAIDIGYAGDAPPIFAQAAKTDLLYLAAVPASAEGILLPPGSELKKLSDLKGKRVAFARGSSAHNMTIAAIEKAGLSLSDIQQTPLAPADAAAAFERGAIDAWTIWDPFYAIHEARPGVRTLVTSDGIAEQNSFLLGARSFVEANQNLTREVVAEFTRVCEWAAANKSEVVRLVSEGTGVPLEATQRQIDRYPFRVVPMAASHIKSQQDIADRFQRAGVTPVKVNVADAVWRFAS